jgi:ribonuclease HI
MKRSILKIYTDGSCLGNPGAGAAAAIFVINNNVRFSITEGCRRTNNQIEELRAAVIGLEAVKILKLDCNLQIYTDSNYVLKGITEWISNWKKNDWKTSNNQPVKHKEMWQRFDRLYVQYKPEMIKVKGHSGDVYNDIVDKLAKSCAKRYQV